MKNLARAIFLLVALEAPCLADSGIASFQNSKTVTSASAVVLSTINTTGTPMKYYSVQVKGSTGTPTSWDVRLEGSLDGLNWSPIMAHQTSDGDGTVKISSSPIIFPASWIRARLNQLTFGSSASSLKVIVLGSQ